MAETGHGGKEIQERILKPEEAKQKIPGLVQVPIRKQIANEIIDIAYGWFTPLEGFMSKKEVDSVVKDMTLPDGTIWPIPILLDLSEQEISDYGVETGKSVVLTYQGNPMALLEVDDVFEYDREEMCKSIFGTSEEKHPGCKRTYDYKQRFVGGKITLLKEPTINEPFGPYFLPPLKMREKFKEKGWTRSVAHQTRNVPHTGHEWLMKGAFFQTLNDQPVEKPSVGVVVNAIIGEKRVKDYIDEAIVLTHDELNKTGYFGPLNHMTSLTFWDMRYAGPKEAIFHAILRINLGITHHMFGRDHAGVGEYYGGYEAHHLLEQVRDKLDITPVYSMNWLYCPKCGEITSEGLCTHKDEQQKFSGTLIRSIVTDGVKPPKLIIRPEVFDKTMECANKYGAQNSPFVNEEYLETRSPVFNIEPL